MHYYVIVNVFTTVVLQGNPWPSARLSRYGLVSFGKHRRATGHGQGRGGSAVITAGGALLV